MRRDLVAPCTLALCAPASLAGVVIDGNELYSLRRGFSESLVVNGNVNGFQITNDVIHHHNIGIDAIGFEGVAPDPAYDQARNGVIRSNRVYSITSANNPAYGGSRGADGIYVDGGQDIVIERNTIYATDIGVELASEHRTRATSGITVRNNLIYRNYVVGISIGGYDTLRGYTQRCVVVNNTLYQNDTLQTGTGEISLQFDTRTTTIKNNIIYSNGQGILITNRFTQNTGNMVDSNLFFVPGGNTPTWQWKNISYTSLAAYRAGTGNDRHSLLANPLFVNLATLDLHLQATSPAIDAAENLAAAGTQDIDGQARLQGRGIDIGADERK